MAFFREGFSTSMTSSRENTTETTALDDDVSAIINEYSIPNLADFASESLLTRSQYAKVIFHDLLPCYPTDADIWCRYSLTDGIKSRHGDRIALYRVGWVSVHDHVQFEVTPVSNEGEEKEFRVLFKAENLPKDTTEFYQLCYVNVDDTVCGASVPFQFRHPVEGELCEVEEQGGLMVVRSTTAVSEEKLRDAAKLIDELESEKLTHREKIQSLESTKDSLLLKVEQLSSMQQTEAQLRQDIQQLENEKTQAVVNLKEADKRIQSLSAKVDSLNKDNTVLNEILKSESHKVMSEELSRYRLQVDNMQQMLDALTESKELASQALQCEQTKVMTLNIEHDKYKFRSQQLDEENKALKFELHQNKSLIETLEVRLKQNELLLQSKFNENEVTMGKLQEVIKQIGQLQYQLNQVNEKNDCLQLQLKQRDNQILKLDMEMQDLRKGSDCLEQLNEEYTNLKRQLQDFEAVQAELNSLKSDNAVLRKEVRRLEEKATELQNCKHDWDQLASEFELLTASHMALQREVPTRTAIQELRDENLALRSRLELENSREITNIPSGSSIEQLKGLLTAAEASNASLMSELKQIKERQPDQAVDLERSSCSRPTIATESLDQCISCITLHRAPVKNANLKQMFLSLKDSREKLEAELEDVSTKEKDFFVRSNSKSKRLVEIEQDVDAAKSLLDLAMAKNKQANNDLVTLNTRMVSIQQQILNDDQREGRSFYDSGDQERLQKMSKRCFDLEGYCSESATEIHDLQQNMQVLDQERTTIEEELLEKPWAEKKFAEDKCKILERLVSIDQEIIRLREGMDSFGPTEPETDVYKTCQTSPSSQRDPEGSARLPEKIAVAGQLMDQNANSDSVSEGSSCSLVVSLAQDCGFEKIPYFQPVEKAVESGVREGIVHGINALKQEASKQLTPGSVVSSTESIESVEQKYAAANEEFMEQERVLQEKLAAALNKTVRTELLSGARDSDSGQAGAVNGITEVEADLKLRLEMAAEEYRKLYMQKLKVEKQLAKMQQKQVASASRPSPSLTCTPEEKTSFVCPICSAHFLAANRDAFTRHYHDHLF